MKKLLLVVLGTLAIVNTSAYAQIDYLGNHLETVRENNLRRHQQEMASGKSRKQKSKQRRTRNTRAPRKESNLSVSRLRVGDRISAIHFGKNNLVFNGPVVRVASRSPLRLNINGTSPKPYPKGHKVRVGGNLFALSTGRRSGVIGVMTLDKAQTMKFTRLNNG